MIRPVTITDSETSYDLLHQRLERSLTHKHTRGECISTSESGSNTCIARFKCSACSEFYNEEFLPAEYERFCAEEFKEPAQ